MSKKWMRERMVETYSIIISVCFFKRIERVNFIGLLCLKDYGNVKIINFKDFRLPCLRESNSQK